MTYTPITTEKIKKDVWIAKTNLTSPMNVEITMKGTSAENAKDKLIKMLKEE